MPAGRTSLLTLFVGALLASALVVAGASGAAAKPTITSVALGGSPAKPLFVIHGKNFGQLPGAGQLPPASSACRAEKAPGNQGVNFGNKLYFVDASSHFSVGLSGPYKGVSDVIDCVGVILKSFSSSRVEYALGSDYTKHPYSVRSGDSITFVVNGATATLRVRYGVTVSNPKPYAPLRLGVVGDSEQAERPCLSRACRRDRSLAVHRGRCLLAAAAAISLEPSAADRSVRRRANGGRRSRCQIRQVRRV